MCRRPEKSAADMTEGTRSRTCTSCGYVVPLGTYCVRCGARLGEGDANSQQRGFAAAPHERLHAVGVVSTLFPQLPRASLKTFRLAFIGGGGVVLLLGIFRLFPAAIVAAAILVPLLTLIYLYDVDVYEDEPLQVIGLTLIWGAVAGIGIGVLGRKLAPSGLGSFDLSLTRVLVRGMLLPILATALAVAGPLILLPYRRFNDVLDGTTFGAVSGAALVGAQVITQSGPLLRTGLHPGGATVPWLLRLGELSLAMPVIAASTGGAAAGAFWLRYRAPVRDRSALGIVGRPVWALVLASAFLVAGAIAQLTLSKWPAFVILVALAAVALVWLRQLIHLGLLAEAAEIEIGPEISCANCGESTPFHSFCSRCGVCLRALPKGQAGRLAPDRPPVEDQK
jgi:hypothetical protein